jgi:CMP-2-keto-3-deoxyoctulosonic acid synthetase
LINKNIKVVIPARYDFRRLPGKLLIDLGGESIVINVSTRVAKALFSADLWVATDDLRIKDVVLAYGYQVMITSASH